MKSIVISWLTDEVKQVKEFPLPLQRSITVGRDDRCDVHLDYWRWQDIELSLRDDQQGIEFLELQPQSIAKIQLHGKSELFGAGQTRVIRIRRKPIEVEVNQQRIWLQLQENQLESHLTPDQLEELDRKISEIHNLVSVQRIDEDVDRNHGLRNREILKAFRQRVGNAGGKSMSPEMDGEPVGRIPDAFDPRELAWLARHHLQRLFFADLFGSTRAFVKTGQAFDKLVIQVQSRFARHVLARHGLPHAFELIPALVTNSDLAFRFKMTCSDAGSSARPDRLVKMNFNARFAELHVERPDGGNSALLRQSIQEYIQFAYRHLNHCLDSVISPLGEPELIETASRELLAYIDDLHKYGPLTRFFDKQLRHITDISVDRNGEIYISVQGRFFPISERIADCSLQKTIDGIRKKAIGKLDRTSPILNSEVEGLRANLVHAEIGGSHQITLRKKFLMHFSLRILEDLQCFPPSVTSFLKALIRSRKNIIVSGGLGSGKTSLLIALLDALSRSWKIATIEDTREIELASDQHFTPHLTRAGIDEKGLLQSILRSAADVIALGEIRSPEAADAMVKALNTGQVGITTIHSNSARDTVSRLVNLLTVAGNGNTHTVSQSLDSAVDFIIHMKRNEQGLRQIHEICEVAGVDRQTGKLNLKSIYESAEQQLVSTGMLPRCIVELIDQGFQIEQLAID